MKTATVVLNEKEHEVRELRTRKLSKWLTKLEGPVAQALAVVAEVMASTLYLSSMGIASNSGMAFTGASHSTATSTVFNFSWFIKSWVRLSKNLRFFISSSMPFILNIDQRI